MIKDFKDLQDDSRIWIYQSNRKLSEEEIAIIEPKIMEFLTHTHIDYIISEFEYELNFTEIKTFLYNYISYHIIEGVKIKSYQLLRL